MENSLLTAKEIRIINKKFSNKPLSQQDSNCLSRFVRPKLRKMANIDALALLDRLRYNPSQRIIENKIKKIVLEKIPKIDSVIVFGSAIQTNYKEYNDIDIIIVTKGKLWKNKYENIKLCSDVQKRAKEDNLNLDVQIISKKDFLSNYSSSPTLIYQLKDHKVIYGDIKMPEKIKLSKEDLKTKLDWSEMEDNNSKPEDIYKAIRNVILVRLLMNKIVDNHKLKLELINNLGMTLINHLKENKASKLEREYALAYLDNLVKQTKLEVSKFQNIVI